MRHRDGQYVPAEVTARIVEQTEALVKELMEVAQQAQTAGEAEAQVAEVWLQRGAAVLGELLSMRFGQQEGSHRACACGGQMKFVGYRGRKLWTVLGRARIERAYYWCADCGATHYVGAEELGDGSGGKSLGVQEHLSLLSAHMPFEEAADKLRRLQRVETCTSEVERHAEAWGDRLEAEWESEVEAVFEAQAEVLPEATPERLYVAVDACKTPMRGRGEWRETKIGAVYEPCGRDDEGLDKAGRTTYVGLVYRSYEALGRRLYVEALRRGLGVAKEVVVLGDGAPWIWELAATHFPQATQIVDWFHASEHVWKVANDVYGLATSQAQDWAESQLAHLAAGEVEALIQALHDLQPPADAAETVRKDIEYFATNRDRMRYNEYRDQGMHIGSGIVESACKHVANGRLKLTGCHWTQPGAQATLNLRILDLNDRWEAYWDRQRRVA